MKNLRPLIAFAAFLSICGCNEDCGPIRAELKEAKIKIAEQDSMMASVGSTFMQIDSNLSLMRSVEYELAGQLRGKNQDKAAVRSNVEKLRNIMEMNQSYIENLENNLNASSTMSKNLFLIISSMEEKVMDNNLRLARLNHDLGVLGDDFKNMFDEYMQAEVSRMVMEENIQQMEGSLTEMEAQMQELKNQMNTAYLAIGTKRELIDRGVLEKGGLLKPGGLNDDVDRMAMEPLDMRKFNELKLGSAKAKVLSNHPTESYRIENGTLIIEAPKLFWSLSRFLIVVTD